MSDGKFEKLSKEELDFLYYFVRSKSMFSKWRVSSVFFLPEFNGIIYDKQDIRRILDKLVLLGYLETDNELWGEKFDDDNEDDFDVAYGIKDRSTYELLCQQFKTRIYLDKISSYLGRLGNFLLNHITTIIVSIITSLLTMFFALQFFGK